MHGKILIAQAKKGKIGAAKKATKIAVNKIIKTTNDLVLSKIVHNITSMNSKKTTTIDTAKLIP